MMVAALLDLYITSFDYNWKRAGHAGFNNIEMVVYQAPTVPLSGVRYPYFETSVETKWKLALMIASWSSNNADEITPWAR